MYKRHPVQGVFLFLKGRGPRGGGRSVCSTGASSGALTERVGVADEFGRVGHLGRVGLVVGTQLGVGAVADLSLALDVRAVRGVEDLVGAAVVGDRVATDNAVRLDDDATYGDEGDLLLRCGAHFVLLSLLGTVGRWFVKTQTYEITIAIL